jgi:hypothetical protein
MIKINLIDSSFSHLTTEDGKYSMIHGKKTKNIIYERNKESHDGITIFTDSHLDERSIASINSRYKIGWFLENRGLNPNPYCRVNSFINHLDMILTNDKKLLEDFPNKAIFAPFGGSWIQENNISIHPKNKLVSIIYSNKSSGLPGYRLRHAVAAKYSDMIDLFGNGSPNPVEFKEEALCDYMFTIVIENISDDNYFTEKIVDPMLVGTVPVYWGCPNIDDFFDPNGILNFTHGGFETILKSLNGDLYQKLLPHAKKNFNIAKKYEVTEDWIYENILKGVYV